MGKSWERDFEASASCGGQLDTALKKTFGSGWFVGTWGAEFQLDNWDTFWTFWRMRLIDWHHVMFCRPIQSCESNSKEEKRKKIVAKLVWVAHRTLSTVQGAKPIEWGDRKKVSCLLMTARGCMRTARLISSYSFPCFPSNSLLFPCRNFWWIPWKFQRSGLVELAFGIVKGVIIDNGQCAYWF